MTRQRRKIPQKRPVNKTRARSALDLIEEAIGLLRVNPALLLPYMVGSFPFLLAVLYFWTDMLRSPFASQHVAEASLGLALLFFWMKSWQAVFAQQVLAHVRAVPPPTWTAGRVWRMVMAQIALQGWGFCVLPAALLLTFPFPWMYALYQNISVYGNGEAGRLKIVRSRAWRQAKLWPRQNSIIIWLISPWLLMLAAVLLVIGLPLIGTLDNRGWWWLLLVLLVLLTIPLNPIGMVIALNIAGALLMLPFLGKTLFGIEPVFTLTIRSATNTTFTAIVFALAYVCLDPVVKVVYVLRCFYGESIRTGEDLRVALRAVSRPAMLAACAVGLMAGLLGAPVGAEAAEPVSPQALEESLRHVLGQAEYSWRLPHEKVDPEDVEDVERHPLLQWMADALEGIGDTLEGWWKTVKGWGRKVRDWWREHFSPDDAPQPAHRRGAWMPGVQTLVFVLLAAIVSVLAVLLWRFLRQRRAVEQRVAAKQTAPAPDLHADDVDARDLPEDGWLAMARELLEQGQPRLALRALYLATLACLADQGLLTIARFKSDRDYARELDRRAHAVPEIPPVFAENMLAFQRAWYGLHAVDQAAVDHFMANYNRLKATMS